PSAAMRQSAAETPLLIFIEPASLQAFASARKRHPRVLSGKVRRCRQLGTFATGGGESRDDAATLAARLDRGAPPASGAALRHLAGDHAGNQHHISRAAALR